MNTYIDLVDEYIDSNSGLSGAKQKSTELHNKGIIEFIDYGYNTILPGHIYTFDYQDTELARDVMTGKGSKLYYNFKPMVFAFKSNDNTIFGIDIAGLPIISRKQLFYNLSKIFRVQIEHNIGNSSVRKWDPILIDSTNYFRIVKVKNKIIINNYDRKKIRNLRIMKWEGMVPATTLYIDRYMIFNAKKRFNIKTLLISQL